MTANSITKSRIEAATRAVDAGREASVRLRDARVAGLSLAIGRRSARWTLDFKVPLPGGEWSNGKRLVLGDLDAMDLEAARVAAATAKRHVGEGLDPVAVKRARRTANVEAAAARTVEAAIARFTAERSADWTRASRRAFAGDFRIINAAIGEVPLALVDRGRLVALITSGITPGGSGLRRAVRIASLLGSLWRAAAQGSSRFSGWSWPGVDPAVADRLPVPGRHRLAARKRVLAESEIRALWPALIAPGPLAPHRLVLAISLATGARIGAVAMVDESDLDLDPLPVFGARDAGPTFTIRAREGTKSSAKDRRDGTDTVLPLSNLAVGLFRRALAIRQGDGPHVFEGRDGPLVSSHVTWAWRALAASGAAPADATAHDLRRSMRTLLGELDHGGSWEDEERLLGHKQGGAVSQAYDRGRRLARLRPLADAWGQRLEAIVAGPPADVVTLRR